MRQAKAILVCGIPLFVGAMLTTQPAACVAVAAEAPNPALAAPKPDNTETRSVQLQNILPSMMAFLIDPAHQREPMVFETSRANGFALPDLPSGSLPAGFTSPTLPPNVEIAKVQDESNSLILRGESRSLDAVETIIASIDKPLRQVEVEMQMLRVSPEALQVLGAPENAPGPHLLGTDAAAKIRSVIADKRAKLVTAPRVTAISGLVANLSSTSSVPLTLPKGEGYRHQDGSPAMPSSLPPTVWISQSLGMAVRPMISADGDIDLEVAAGLSWQVQTAEGAPAMLRPGQRFSLRALDGRSYLLYANAGFAPSVPDIEAAKAVTFSNRFRVPAPLKAEPMHAAQPDADGKISVYIVRATIIKRLDDQEEMLKADLIRQGRVVAGKQP